MEKMISKYRHRYTVTATDMDAEYRLTPNAMLMYSQDCFARMMTVCRLAAFDVVKQNRMWVITEYTADIRPVETFWSEDIVVELWVSERSTLRIYCDFKIMKADGETLIATGSFQMNILGTATHRLEPTDFLAGRCEVVPEMTTGSHKKERFPKMTTPEMHLDHQVTKLDVDFNGHMGNRGYVDIALLTMPDEVLRGKRLVRMIVHWLRKSHLGDTLRCEMSRAEGEEETYLHLLTNQSGAAVCEMLSRWEERKERPDIAEVLERRL